MAAPSARHVRQREKNEKEKQKQNKAIEKKGRVRDQVKLRIKRRAVHPVTLLPWKCVARQNSSSSRNKINLNN